MAAGASTARWVVVERLDVEWRGLVDGSGETVAEWARTHPALVGCADLDDVLLAARHDGDAVLLTLLERGREGDTVAARTVLQAMLGKMVLMAVRTPGSEIEDFLAELWPVIAGYPVQRRRRKVAANLALDTLKNVKRGCRGAELSWDLVPESVQAAALTRSRPAAERLDAGRVLARALELHLIDAATCRVLSAVYLDGMTSAQAGSTLGSSAAMVRYRCSRAVRRLADEAATLARAA